MKHFGIFLRKELFESVRTHKLLIVGAVFFILGMMSPLFAKMTPEILQWAAAADPASAGMNLTGLFTTPSALDAWAQFYSNVGQMGTLTLVIVFAGMLSSELSKGTLTILLSKGLPRGAVVLSKLTGAVLIWTASLALSFFTALLYTVYLFPGGGLSGLYFAVFCLWGFGVFLLALTTLAAALTDRSFVCMLAVGAAVIVFNIFNIIPAVRRYNPASLAGLPMSILAGAAAPRDAYPALAAAGVATVVFVLLAVLTFTRKNLSRAAA